MCCISSLTPPPWRIMWVAVHTWQCSAEVVLSACVAGRRIPGKYTRKIPNLVRQCFSCASGSALFALLTSDYYHPASPHVLFSARELIPLACHYLADIPTEIYSISVCSTLPRCPLWYPLIALRHCMRTMWTMRKIEIGRCKHLKCGYGEEWRR